MRVQVLPQLAFAGGLHPHLNRPRTQAPALLADEHRVVRADWPMPAGATTPPALRGPFARPAARGSCCPCRAPAPARRRGRADRGSGRSARTGAGLRNRTARGWPGRAGPGSRRRPRLQAVAGRGRYRGFSAGDVRLWAVTGRWPGRGRTGLRGSGSDTARALLTAGAPGCARIGPAECRRAIRLRRRWISSAASRNCRCSV